MKLQKGMPAPDFELEDPSGKVWRLSDLRDRKVVLYFYPQDDTPGCTAQACDFRDGLSDFQDAGYTVLGVSPQDAGSHTVFARKYALNFPLLVDPDHAVAKRYGAWGERSLYGRRSEGIIRSTFVIDGDGRVSDAQYAVKAKGHVERLRRSLAV